MILRKESEQVDVVFEGLEIYRTQSARWLDDVMHRSMFELLRLLCLD